jgi:hypothetical protein
MLDKIKSSHETIDFQELINYIDQNYDFEPVAFLNGELENAAGQNNGSCKVFQFALIEKLSPDQTLKCFGAYYFEDVLKNPEANNHQNIRNFMKHGFGGLHFEKITLNKKA